MNRYIAWFLIILFVLGTVLIWRPFADPELIEETDRFREIEPDFTATGMILRIYSEDGALAHRIAADTMTHFSPISLTELTNPVYTVRSRDQKSIWQVIAEQGSFYDDKTLVLERGIEITNLTSNDFLERVETSYLTIDTTEETVETDAPVVIFGQNFTVRGVGLQGNLRTQTLEINEHAQAIYTGISQLND
ncbi:LPS export ABC transporter periplasmic protein LptC [Pseudidiomarina sp.]|uniref:LPS export ABC transporter periplasmic protein LptC n=1 Tax=Pseudidiomarina sp. TaxID=2081707 RepID=UPI00299E9477|nr:LPS export ABC transporter periplasmic protein LptC [Pseudidiomarina sp.]MDX1705196.1 LPS export ABC transporter periplasmic protein LptC [Pseudidiomarina sp.]